MPLALTSITSGASASSAAVTVTCTEVDGTVILLHRGNAQIGSGTLAAGVCIVAVAPLATGDVIYASVTEKGNRCGSPVVVTATDVRVTGWKTPTELIVIVDGDELTMPADLFRETYGYLPASIYDPEGTGAIIFPEYEASEVGGIGFDLLVTQKFEQTQVFVQNVRGTKGATFVRFNGGGWSGVTSITLTAAASLQIDVRGEDDTEFATRTISVAVSSDAAESLFDTFYRIDYMTNGIAVFAHKSNSLQFRLEGFDMTWLPGSVNAIDEWSRVYVPVPAGSYIGWVRNTGDVNPANWGKIEFVKLV